MPRSPRYRDLCVDAPTQAEPRTAMGNGVITRLIVALSLVAEEVIDSRLEKQAFTGRGPGLRPLGSGPPSVAVHGARANSSLLLFAWDRC